MLGCPSGYNSAFSAVAPSHHQDELIFNRHGETSRLNQILAPTSSLFLSLASSFGVLPY